jgi:hypothetical protein
MSLTLESLAPIAMLGTERQPLPALAAETTAVGRLQQSAQTDNPEATLLSLAAITAIHQRAGALPARATAPLPAPSAMESNRRVNDRASVMLRQMLSGRFVQLIPEWLRIARENSQIVSPETLPALLELGAKTGDLRELLTGVIGERGLWLAKQNPDWAWVGGTMAGIEDSSLWETGLPQVRLELLKHLRASDPARARELLASTWKDDSPDDRALFLDALSIQLADADEEFLEQALGDKRKEVRKCAAKLLARLPHAKFAERMIARADQYVHFIAGEAGGLLKMKRSKPAAIDLSLPEHLEAAWQRDSIDAKPPKGIGEKAWWIIQLLESTPLRHWSAKWNVAPGEIVSASLASEWKSELVEAWTRGSLLQRSADWAEALFPAAKELGKTDRLPKLLELMNPASVEESLAALLDAKAPEAQLVFLTRHDWSADFSGRVLSWLRAATAQDSYDWQMRNRIPELAARLAPEALGETAAGWPSPETKAWDFWRGHVEEFLAAADFRREMIGALHARI